MRAAGEVECGQSVRPTARSPPPRPCHGTAHRGSGLRVGPAHARVACAASGAPTRQGAVAGEPNSVRRGSSVFAPASAARAAGTSTRRSSSPRASGSRDRRRRASGRRRRAPSRPRHSSLRISRRHRLYPADAMRLNDVDIWQPPHPERARRRPCPAWAFLCGVEQREVERIGDFAG